MANHGSKFVSVNLNKSYGQKHHHHFHHTNYPQFNGDGGPYGPHVAGRGRSGSGGSGGMLVLSRTRGVPPKVATKLSVPPPLNLPSLRKEHEKFDTSGPGGSGAGTGSGSRPTSSGMGWTKPVAATTALPEKNEIAVETPVVDGTSASAVASRAIGSYMPPSARSSGSGAVRSASSSSDITPAVHKVVLLRGEDFPSLQAARPVSSGTSQKQKDVLNQKQKQVVRDEVSQDKEGNYHSDPLANMQPVGRASSDARGNGSVENGDKGRGTDIVRTVDHIWKQEEYFPDPLSLVRLNPRSDWADDERDTGHVSVEKGRDIGYTNTESYWDGDFDLPRPVNLPHKPAPNNRWSQRDNETGNNFFREVPKVDPYNKDARAPSREGKEVNNKWKNSPLSKDGFGSQEASNYRVDAGSRKIGQNMMMKENNYASPYYGNINRDGCVTHTRDSVFERRGSGLVGYQQQRNNTMESYNNRGTERNSGYVTEQPYRYRSDNFQSSYLSKSSFGKMSHIADPLLNMGRDKRFSNTDKPFSEDPFSIDYGDEGDLFPKGLVGVIKKKKDAAKPTDFHDPVRESFEAELEKVQKVQELERQRIIEEQERALEQARREEEERRRRIGEEDEQKRKLEKEAREAAWRAEQERAEAVRKAEEQRISREEERKRIQLEEERRKLAAKQKLEELEAKMAKRQAESSKSDTFVAKSIVDEKAETTVKEIHISRNLDLDTWENSERLVENMMASGSFDSSSHSALVEMGSRPYPPIEGSSNFADRGKANKNWKRDGLLENDGGIPPLLSVQDSGNFNPRREAFAGGVRATPRKEFYSGPGYISSRPFLKPGMQEPYADEFGYHKDHHRWDFSGNADPYGKFREMDAEFHDGIADRYGDSGWGQGRPRVNTRPPYPERLYPNSEANDLYNYGRSRYSMRQPRVPPPPSLASSQRLNTGVTEQLHGPSTFVDNSLHYTHASRTESTTYYDSNREGLLESSEDKNLNSASRCDSQSSLSVSSPPTSPPQLSHDDLDESGDSQVVSSVADGKRNLLTGSLSVAAHNGNSGNSAIPMVSANVSAVEDEEWTVKNDYTVQQQEEYDEDEDGYREEDEVRERDDENLDLTQNLEGLELEVDESSHAMDNVVLGFDEGVEVVLPNDDFEKKIETKERSFETSKTCADIVEERGPADDLHGTNVPDKSSDGTGLAAPQSTSLTSATSQTNNNMPYLSSSGSPDGLPVKLQFGLFSGPSLIPSPVPAIQIGSIQMPLHIHPPVGQSITRMQSSQPPMFQFGQLRYTSPISQGILPMTPQSLSCLHQPNIMGHFNLNQNVGDSVVHEPSRENVTKYEAPSVAINQQRSVISESPEQSGVSGSCDEKTKSTSGPPVVEKGQRHVASRNYSSSSRTNASESQSHHVQLTTQFFGGDKNNNGPRGFSPMSGGRGRRFAYAVKNTNTRFSVRNHDLPLDSNGFQRRPRRTVQRTEYRVRENNDRRLPPVSFSNAGLDGKPNYGGKGIGVFTRSGSKRGTVFNTKQRSEAEPSASGNVASQEVSGDSEAKEPEKDLPIKIQSASQTAEANLRRNIYEEDVDAPLQSGVVCVFTQPGIEAPNDEDDFIEVRSKRQMLNDRREQREKEVKAKSRITKPAYKPRVSRPYDGVSRSHNKPLVSLGSEEDSEVSRGYTASTSQPPIGTPPVNSDAQAIKRSNKAGSVSTVSNGGTECVRGVNIDSKNKVMSLSQSQFDEAMKPTQYDSSVPSVGGHASTVSDPILPTPSVLTKDKTFSSGSGPITSLLAGEKIQFGAITSPTVLTPTSSVISYGIGAPGSNRRNPQKSCKIPVIGKEDSLFFSNEKHVIGPVQRSEAEAEAAASAVAVAAISSDEMVENNNEAKSFGSGISGITTGAMGDEHFASQSQSELLSVSLPADLSVETTPISMWTSLPSPQSSSSQMVSHFPAGPHSHFPFYEMNPLLGGPIFAFNPHEESSGGQSQPPKCTPTTSGQSLGNWPQCHSGVDSFYTAPAGYSGPFIGTPGGIPGVQGPTPHMLVYNHFAPVGQYGQVGLSFMGTTYIPSGKQADWKNNTPTSSAGVGSGGEGDVNDVNMSNVQRSSPNMTGPIQHLAPGSPLLPMPSPMPMFDVSPFQTASDLPIQARWGHIPTVPLSRSLQPQTEGAALHAQVGNHAHPTGQSLTANRFIESRTPTQPDNNNRPSFTVSSDTNVTQFPSELGLSDPLRSTSASLGQSVPIQSSSGNAIPESGSTDTVDNTKLRNSNTLKIQFSKKNVSSNQKWNNNNNNNSGYGYQRGGGTTRRGNIGNEFSHRRMGYHGRNQSSGVDKGIHSSKVKQIYVVKRSASGTSST